MLFGPLSFIMTHLPAVALVFTFTSGTAEFAPKSGEELKAAVDSITNRTGTLFPPVDIVTGTSKFLLIKVKNPKGQSALIVRSRGGPDYPHHFDVAAPIISEIDSAGWTYDVLGGGTLVLDEQKKTILIHGACGCDLIGEVEFILKTHKLV